MEQLEILLRNHTEWAIVFSIICNTIISIMGVIPSVFLTAFNVHMFDFAGGFMLSLAGEAIGAVLAFLLYRRGFRKWADKQTRRYPKAERLLHAEGKEAFLLVISLRLLPFMPSGLVTLLAAIGKISTLTFIIASTIGKVPALLIEAYSVYAVLAWGGAVQFILGAASFALLVYLWKRMRM